MVSVDYNETLGYNGARKRKIFAYPYYAFQYYLEPATNHKEKWDINI